ncbi:MAG: hypothetical protein ACREUS_08555, partial [Burkholderiales bacterium]
VLYMAAGDAPRVRDALIEAGVAPDMPVALVENASLQDSRSVSGKLTELESLTATRGEGPAVILLGRVLAKAALSQSDVVDLVRAPAAVKR